MLDIVIGIALGAAFSPFWMMLWGMVKTQAVALFEKYKK